MISEIAALGVYGINYTLGKDVLILNEISFEIKRGEILVLYGPNGSGKTTLLKAISGLLPLTDGVVQYMGSDFLCLSPKQKAIRVVYLPSDMHVEFPLTAFQAVQLGRSSQGGSFLNSVNKEELELIEATMKKCFCWDLRNHFVYDLSGGERQLVSLARAIVQGARVLLLDESFSKLDLNHQVVVGALLKNLSRDGYSIVLVTHDLNFASEWADTALLLKKGEKVAYGEIQNVLSSENMKKLYPETEFFLGKNPITGAPKIFFTNKL